VTVSDPDLLAQHFEIHQAYLRGVALRMLGSSHEAGDAVQEAWLRSAGPTPTRWRTSEAG
jgi:RNA polymerase sigma-70 factor (ECF subfamily)